VSDSPNVALVRSIYADWERGDFSRSDWADPDIEFVITDGPAPGHWTGLASMAAAWREILSVVEDARFEAEEYQELDTERVLVLVNHSGRAKVSGVEIGQMRAGANLFHMRGGTVNKLFVYFDRDRALADLGLPPEGDAQ
jgi:hypothetical protein